MPADDPRTQRYVSGMQYPPIVRRLPIPLLLASLAIAFGPMPGAARADEPAFEQAPKAVAADVLPAALLSGKHHTVRAAVGQRRLLQTFKVESEFGVYDVTSRRLLEIRVREIETLSRVANVKGGSEFFRSLGKSLASIPTGAVEFVLSPADSVRKLGKGLEKTGDRVRDLFGGGTTSAYESSSLDNAFSGDEQREIAAQLGLDVYSTNPQVRKFLNEIASARAAGSLGVDLASFALPVVGFMLVTTAKWRADVARLLRDKSPLELHRHNTGVLTQLGIPRATLEAFLRNRMLSPRHKTTITAALAELPKVRGITAVLEAATTARDEIGALYHEQQAILLAHVHREGGGLVSLRRVRHVVIGRQTVGREVVFLPVDQIYWMEDFRDLADGLKPTSKEASATRIHIRGHITKRAQAELESRAFEVVTDYRR